MDYTEYWNSDREQIKPAINELLQVHLIDDPNPGTYRSRIENIVEEKLVTTWPTAAGIRMPVHADQMLIFSLVRDGVAYAFTGLVDSTSTEPLPQITVIINSEIHRVQRRQNFRIKSLVPIDLTGAVYDGKAEESSVPFFLKTNTYNISAGGVAIRSSKGIQEGTPLNIRIYLPDHNPLIKVPCRVIYNEPAIGNPELHQSGLQFLIMTEKERARIVRYIYRTQLQGLRE